MARRAGIAKGSLYRYFENKSDLFRAVVQDAVAENLRMIEAAGAVMSGSLQELVPQLLLLAADQPLNNRATALARMVIAESQAFPDLAKTWNDNVASKVLSMLTALIRQAQERGEIRHGDLLVHAFSIVGPMVAGLIFREVFGQTSGEMPNLKILARQHAETVLRGLNSTWRFDTIHGGLHFSLSKLRVNNGQKCALSRMCQTCTP